MPDTPKTIQLIVDSPESGVLRLVLSEASGTELASEDLACQGHVDNILLTAVDNLLRRSKLHKSALTNVKVGVGIDKNSSLYRIVQSFASAIAAVHLGRT